MNEEVAEVNTPFRFIEATFQDNAEVITENNKIEAWWFFFAFCAFIMI